MSNARCLTEGTDVPTVDMVAFLTPKRSKVDIVQAVGRAMRNAPGKTTGYILVPLYVEQAAGESLDAAVARDLAAYCAAVENHHAPLLRGLESAHA